MRLCRGPVSPWMVNAICYDFCEELRIHEIAGGAGPFPCFAWLRNRKSQLRGRKLTCLRREVSQSQVNLKYLKGLGRGT